MLTSMLVALALAGAPKVDPKLVGTWTIGGAPFMTLNANGTGQMEEGKLKWTADGSSLVVTDEEGVPDKVGYSLQGDTLTLTMGGMPMTLTRAGAGVEVKKQSAFAAKAAKANRVSEAEADREAMAEAQAWLAKNGQAQGAPQPGGQAMPPRGPAQPAAQKQPARTGIDGQLAQLLTSSAWCSFSYNQNTGTSHTARYRFLPNGTWSNGARGETYNSGYAGTVAGQYDSGGGGRWDVRGGQLWLSEGANPLQPAGVLNVQRNSSGAPIIVHNGTEFASCN